MTQDRQLEQAVTPGKLVVVAALCGILFYFGLLIFERVPEIPVDIDWKPFFIPLAFIALLPTGKATWALALGAALGEAFGDILEGYEPDDPVGFVAYVIGFGLAGYVIRNEPRNLVRLSVAAVVAGGVQAFIEASAFLIFGEESLPVMIQSAIGNTLTHGVALGLIPLLILVPLLHGRVERLLGFPTLGRRPATTG